MREISAKNIVEAVKNLCIEASYNLGEDVEEALNRANGNGIKEIVSEMRAMLRRIIFQSWGANNGSHPVAHQVIRG